MVAIGIKSKHHCRIKPEEMFIGYISFFVVTGIQKDSSYYRYSKYQ